MQSQIRTYQSDDREEVTKSIAMLRVTLATQKSRQAAPDYRSAAAELDDYVRLGFPIFVAVTENRIVGHLVCRIVEDIVWAESLHVMPEYRRLGVASSLYSEAERLAENLGSSTVYNWIHPNNQESISFLRSKGYTVLNLIELRKPWPNERLMQHIQVGDNKFDY
jgi:ribosomal protein S18 acetylase RimI-like enzyme